mmetsp:Transcript_40231/g.96403  ORF Transcript_40231/g.96403 Transcript_40231/m.96403 type:complete len:646 (-) Transcript_40231:183-2120(-)
MSLYKFKEIQTVPNAKDFIDIVLSRVQRKTPTQVHPQFKITRIRSFYMRKVKYAQTTFNEKFTKILEDFPMIDDIHPFYADLCNVLYDRDHYKLALGQVNTVRGVVDTVAKDYCKLMKFADSPYKSKMLKRAALGRMCTAVKKLQSSLVYLEEVRQHLGRLPSINPNARTLLVTGYPNVGKSSFMNIVTNANVEVQAYAFTTKSLYVGHMDYDYLRWQVIDTPGILDHPLEDRNTIEMTAITALAHIQASVLFFVDISETCGFTLEQQVALFHSIKPLFKGKPLLVVLNKQDLRKVEDLSAAERELLNTMCDGEGSTVKMMSTSCATKVGVDEVKIMGCDALLKRRLDHKVEGNKTDSIMNRVHVTSARAPASRPAFIPPTLQQQKEAKMEVEGEDSDSEEFMTEKELRDLNGGSGVYSTDYRKQWILENEAWRYDAPPEIVDGMNVADYIDPDIEAKVAALEAEEDLLLRAFEMTPEERAREAEWSVMSEKLTQVRRIIRYKKSTHHSRRDMGRKEPRKIRKSLAMVEDALRDLGRDPSLVRERALSRKSEKVRAKRRAYSLTPEAEAARSVSRSRSLKPSRESLSLHRPADKEKAGQLRAKAFKVMFRKSKIGMKGEADRHVPTKKPKHLFTGKRPKGTANHR